jgi:hypothetical protein
VVECRRLTSRAPWRCERSGAGGACETHTRVVSNNPGRIGLLSGSGVFAYPFWMS